MTYSIPASASDGCVRSALACAVLLLLSPMSQPRAQGGWVKGSYLDASCPPFIFLTQPLASARFGVDVVDQFNLGSPGRQLMFMDHRLSDPVLLFPLEAHLGAELINSPRLGDGSVHEPSVYFDSDQGQYWVFFSYANDLANRHISKPCDIYAMNVTAAVNDPTGFDPASLPVSRLTNSPTSASAIFNQSFNPTWASQAFWTSGIGSHIAIHQSPCVVDEEHGPSLYLATNERRADGFGLQIGDLKFRRTSVELVNRRETQHFGTTSLIGFFETPGGCAGSYRSSIESIGQWSIFEFGSDEGHWATLTGYANGPNIADHNGTTVAISDDPEDSFVAITRYYINNNQGFGSILMQPYRLRGLNRDDGRFSISQAGMWNLFPQIDPTADSPSRVGKFGLPAGGRKGSSASETELFLTYSTNESNDPAAGPQSYHLTLVAITDLSGPIRTEARDPAPSSYAAPAFDEAVGVYGVLKHPGRHVFAMRPLLTHRERFGWPHREVAPLAGKPGFTSLHHGHLADMPVAQVTAGPLYNTDVRPYRRRSGSYDPTRITRNGAVNSVELKTACLTKDVNPEDLSAADIAGVRVFVTDPKVQRHYYVGSTRRLVNNSGWGYLHHNGSNRPGLDADAIEFERVRLLSDVQAEADGSISFVVPSDVPLRFSLVHRDGTVLAAHRGHHSFQDGQRESSCTGCHNHQVEGGASPAGLTAFDPAFRPFDAVTRTGKFDWDQAGNLTYSVQQAPSLPVPEFKADIWPILQSECGSCHDSEQNANGIGLARFDMNMPLAQAVPRSAPAVDRRTAIWSYLHNQRYINRNLGAAKSQLAWYFAGLSGDHVLRLDGEYNRSYNTREGSRYWITTSFRGSNPHPGVADKRKAYKVIEWIDSGAGIDHDCRGSGGETINGGGLNYDGYQIALSMRLRPSLWNPRDLIVGYWDVASNVRTIRVYLNGRVHAQRSLPAAQGNGTVTFALPAGLGDEDQIRVEAIDANDNHSRTEKSVRQLRLEAEPLRGEYALSVGQRGARAQPVVGGTRVRLSIDSSASHRGESFLLAMSASGYHPGTLLPVPGVYKTLNADALTYTSLGIGFAGVLDETGSAGLSLPIPPAFGVPLHFEALVLSAANVGKTNMVLVKAVPAVSGSSSTPR